MSVIIKGINKPKNCWDCPLVSGYQLTDEEKVLYSTIHCRMGSYVTVDGKRIPKYQDPYAPGVCPIIELPPHGRLIDADALMEDGWKLYKRVEYEGYSAIHEMPLICPSIPTIIEAEKGEK